jgi:hypothetical protein
MSEQISGPYWRKMNTLARVVDDHLNDPEQPKTTCFVLLAVDFDKAADGCANIVSNGRRKDVMAILGGVLDRLQKEDRQ